ncbi:MAG: hypothetical protein DRI95_13165 [Bacteroidetes bacterium]|nr:MAG: hypothetical protein DRI95_13165 [Bacteroidota bacterium]
MSEFGKLEKNIAFFLGKYPWFKEHAKKAYQSLNYLLYKKKYKYKLHNEVWISELKNSENFGSFWGYYDKSSMLNGNVLAHTFSKSLSNIIRSKESINIYLNEKLISKTNSWNWQQGSMLTWMDENRIFHNIFDNGNYKCKILNIKNSIDRIINSPIYSYNRKTDTALGLNFKRLTEFRPDYGYFCHEYLDSVDFDDNNDGVFRIFIENNTRDLIISIEDLKKFKTKSSMINATHKVNHIDISPNGLRFIFLHRWFNKSGEKFSRLISSNVNGSEMFILSDDNMVSHCTWRNNHEIVGWMKKNEVGIGYFAIEDKYGSFKQLGKGILTEDGHPSFSSCGRYMLTDTYPDRSRMSKILLFDTKNEELNVIGEFLSPPKYFGEKRCDLHPRFSDNVNLITFDSVHDGLRNQYSLNITKVL